MLTRSFTFALCLFTVTSAVAQIKPGEKAQPLHITDWISNVPQSKLLAGKLLVIDFWATWCQPCIASTPHMNELVKANADNKNMVFVALSDESPEKIKRTLAKTHFDAVVVADTTGKHWEPYRVRGIPFCVLLDEKMTVQWSGHPSQLSNEMLQQFAQHKPVPQGTIAQRPDNREREILDSLADRYSRVFMDASKKEYFVLDVVSEVQHGMTMTNFNDVYNLACVGVPLSNVIADVFDVSHDQVKLPDVVKGQCVTFCYKSASNTGQDKVIDTLSGRLGMQYAVSQKKTDVLQLSAQDTALLYAHRPAADDMTGGSSQSGDKMSIRNQQVSVMINMLRQHFKMPVKLTDPGQYNINLNMELAVATYDDLVKALAKYGMKVERKEQEVPVYTFVSKN